MTTQNISPLDQARILSEALPHMQEYDEETIVIKYGGHAMGDEDTARAFARDIVLLEQTAINPVVVHGGGPQIATMLKRLGIQSEFAAGLRITVNQVTHFMIPLAFGGLCGGFDTMTPSSSSTLSSGASRPSSTRAK